MISVWNAWHLFYPVGYNLMLSSLILFLKIVQLWPTGARSNWFL